MYHSVTPGTYQPLSAQRLHEGVVQQVVSQIMSGALAPGAFLPSEAALAQQFSVSRTVIREAVRVLVSKGLVAVKHGSGMQVQPVDQWNYLDPIILFEQLRAGHNETLLHDLLELRRVIEVEVAALAALRRSAEDLEALRALVQEMRAILDDPIAYTRLDISYHEAILAACRNRLLGQSLRPVSQALRVGRMISSKRPGGPAESQRGHEEILAAIENQQPDQARDAMRRHLLQFEQDIHTILSAGFSGTIADLANQLTP